jgi:hypothetical protein
VKAACGAFFAVPPGGRTINPEVDSIFQCH